jgi:hypothetical protein
MKCVLRRRSYGLLAAALVVLSACGKKKDAARNEKLAPPASAPDSALKETVAGKPASLPDAPNEIVPAWTQEVPHFFVRDGDRFAAAVGHAKIRDVALARAAAEDAARVALLRLVEGGTPDGAVEGALPGARMTDSFTSKKDGQLFVRLEVRTKPG